MMMPNHEMVIKGLNDIGGFITGRVGSKQARNFLHTIDDAVEMLQQQEDMGKELTDAMELIHKKNERIEKLLKEQEESIPVSWLTEKLEGHPELPYAVTDGITNVLYLWEGR